VLWLDADPVAVTRALEPALRRRWADAGATPLLAAPFETVVPGEWSWFDDLATGS
jgi:hypothetical protein